MLASYRYANGASIFTTSSVAARKFQSEIQVGQVSQPFTVILRLLLSAIEIGKFGTLNLFGFVLGLMHFILSTANIFMCFFHCCVYSTIYDAYYTMQIKNNAHFKVYRKLLRCSGCILQYNTYR